MGRLKKFVLSNKVLSEVALFLRKKNLQWKGHTIASKAKVGFSTVCEGKNRFAVGSSIFGSHVGFGSYISENSHFSKTKIGRYCSIGRNVNCIFGKHPTKDFVSTHPAFFTTNHNVGFSYVDENSFAEHAAFRDLENKYSIVIGNDVWIADNVTLMEGVLIGDGAVVGANALVTKDVPPYTIVGGVPAKTIKKRFTDKEIEFLLELKWWEKPESWIRKYAPQFKSITGLKEVLDEQ